MYEWAGVEGVCRQQPQPLQEHPHLQECLTNLGQVDACLRNHMAGKLLLRCMFLQAKLT